MGRGKKHALVSFYAKLFSTGMKDKWDERVYIELYAGSGRSKIKDTSRIIAGSPLQALMLEHPFDKYIFCEMNPKALDALRSRVEKVAPSAKVAFIEGDCNQRISQIMAEIPPHSLGHRVLSLCFVDPYDMGIKFETLRKLSEKYVDFLVLLALYMDANRNYQNYVEEEAVKIDEVSRFADLARRVEGQSTKWSSLPSVSSRRVFKEYGGAQVSATAVLQDEAGEHS